LPIMRFIWTLVTNTFSPNHQNPSTGVDHFVRVS
jgi:hypothetical protein